MTRRRTTAWATAAALSLALTACGGDEPAASPPSSSSSPGSSPTGSPTTAEPSSPAPESSSATPTLAPPTSTTTATPEFVKAVAQGVFNKARNAPTWSMTRQQSRCVANGMVASFGTDRLVEWGLSQGTPGDRTIEDLGMDEAETGAFVDTLMSCGVITPARLIENTKKSIGSDAEDPTLSACLDKTIDEDLVRALTVDQFLGDAETGDSFTRFQQALVDCVS